MSVHVLMYPNVGDLSQVSPAPFPAKFPFFLVDFVILASLEDCCPAGSVRELRRRRQPIFCITSLPTLEYLFQSQNHDLKKLEFWKVAQQLDHNTCSLACHVLILTCCTAGLADGNYPQGNSATVACAYTLLTARTRLDRRCSIGVMPFPEASS